MYSYPNIFKLILFGVVMKTGRKSTGGKYKKLKKRKLTGRQNQARIVKLDIQKTKLLRGRGGSQKLVSLSDNSAHVIHNGKAGMTAIKNVLETPSHTFLGCTKLGWAWRQAGDRSTRCGCEGHGTLEPGIRAVGSTFLPWVSTSFSGFAKLW